VASFARTIDNPAEIVNGSAKRDHITSHLRVHTPMKPHMCDVSSLPTAKFICLLILVLTDLQEIVQKASRLKKA